MICRHRRSLGKYYWQHRETGKTQWQTPAEVILGDECTTSISARGQGDKMQGEVEEADKSSAVCDSEGFWNSQDRAKMMRCCPNTGGST
jgi:hypothetical protein